MDFRFDFDVFSMILLFVTALAGAYLPRHLAFEKGIQVNDGSSLAFHLGNMLSGGVMLSAGFCHLLADALPTLAFSASGFPTATFLAACGFIITLLADQIVQELTDEPLPTARKEDDADGRLSSADLEDQQSVARCAPGSPRLLDPTRHHDHPPATASTGATTTHLVSGLLLAQGSATAVVAGGVTPVVSASAHLRGVSSLAGHSSHSGELGGRVGQSHSGDPAGHRPKGPVSTTAPGGPVGVDIVSAFANGHRTSHTPGTASKLAELPTTSGAVPGDASRFLHRSATCSGGGGEQVSEDSPLLRTTSGGGASRRDTVPLSGAVAVQISSTAGTASHHKGGHDHDSQAVRVFMAHRPLSIYTTVLLAAALCIHSVLEGMALGAAQTMKQTEDVMIAIAAHKGLAAYALGASIVESRASAHKFWTIVSLFASATPIGIMMGYGFSEVSSGSGGAAMSALASGTFLYVAVMEVIPKELSDPRHRVLKMAMLLLGFGLMSLLAIWA